VGYVYTHAVRDEISSSLENQYTGI